MYNIAYVLTNSLYRHCHTTIWWDTIDTHSYTHTCMRVIPYRWYWPCGHVTAVLIKASLSRPNARNTIHCMKAAVSVHYTGTMQDLCEVNRSARRRGVQPLLMSRYPRPTHGLRGRSTASTPRVNGMRVMYSPCRTPHIRRILNLVTIP